jgi:hypothetical protein
MITQLQIRLACGRIIGRKREKNQALANEQKPPKFALVSTFDELEKEILGKSVSEDGSLRSLESVVLSMVKEGKLTPASGGFCLPETMRESKDKAEKHWSENTTKPIRE